jgi:DNA-binding NarL/FixJ family response regulator
MDIKRVILASSSRLLSEMFHRALEKSDHLEVVQEVRNIVELPHAVQRFCPDWVIVSLPISDPLLEWISTFTQNDPSAQFIFLSEDNHSIKIGWQTATEEDLSNLSLKEFIYLLEKDLQHI